MSIENLFKRNGFDIFANSLNANSITAPIINTNTIATGEVDAVHLFAQKSVTTNGPFLGFSPIFVAPGSSAGGLLNPIYLMNGIIVGQAITEDFAIQVDTAANIITAMELANNGNNIVDGQSCMFYIHNNCPAGNTLSLTTNTGVSISPSPLNITQGNVATILVIVTSVVGNTISMAQI